MEFKLEGRRTALNGIACILDFDLYGKEHCMALELENRQTALKGTKWH